MEMSASTAFIVLSLALALFAVLAVGGLYVRLKQVERGLTELVFGQSNNVAPPRLRPGPGEAATIVLTLDGECPTCHHLSEAVEQAMRSGALRGVRVARVFATETSMRRHGESTAMQSYADSDLWSAVYEGYTPTLSVVDHRGHPAYRRFVYADTDLNTLLAEVRSAVAVLPTGGPELNDTVPTPQEAR